MEKTINLSIEKLPEGVYLGTSKDVHGLVVQADSVPEWMEIAQDGAKQLLSSQARRSKPRSLPN